MLRAPGINNPMDLRYPVMVEGEMVVLRPHDTRHTYAKRLYEMGMDIVSIKDNLGHADIGTTQGYIGQQDMDKRRSPDLFDSPHDLKQVRQLQNL